MTATGSCCLYWSCALSRGHPAPCRWHRDRNAHGGRKGTRDQRSQPLSGVKSKGKWGAGHPAAARCPPHRGEGTAGGGSPVLGLAHVAVPSAAASSARSRFLPPAESRRREKRVKSGPQGMPHVPPGAPFAAGGTGLTGSGGPAAVFSPRERQDPRRPARGFLA